MEDFNKYKDLEPSKTVSIFKQALKRMGIPSEVTSFEEAPGIFSSKVAIPYNIVTGGKGSSQEYSEASGYGEMIERIQNFIFMKTDCNEFPFYYDPSEKILTYKEIKENCKDILFNKEDNIEDICLEFYSVKDKKLIYLPYNEILNMQGSNGMCSGNSPCEALVQGLSEIIERWVEEYIYKNELTPPEISRDYIKEKYSYLNTLIENIENKSESTLRIYDCSLGNDIPALCVILINNKEHSYKKQYGVHPVFSVALERCLSEIIQNCNIATPLERLGNFIYWSQENQDNWKTSYMYSNRINSHVGSIPDRFFFPKKSWQFKEWFFKEDYTNEQGLDFLIKKCLEYGDNIYIRDNNYLSIPTYNIFIPNMTLTKGFQDEELLKLISLENKLIEGEKISLEEENFLYEYFTSKKACEHVFSNLLSYDLVFAAICRDLNKYDEAILHLRNNPPSEEFHEGIIRELELVQQGYNVEERDALLSTFFKDNVVDYIKKGWRDSCFNSLFNKENNIINFSEFKDAIFESKLRSCPSYNTNFNRVILSNKIRTIVLKSGHTQASLCRLLGSIK